MSLNFYVGVILLGVGVAVFVVWNIWYTNKIKNHLIKGLAALSNASAQHNGRLVTIESTVQQCRAAEAGATDRMNRLSYMIDRVKKTAEKVGSLAGQVPALQKEINQMHQEIYATDGNMLSGDKIAYEGIEQIASELKALAKELGYEITTTTNETVSTVTKTSSKIKAKREKV